MKAAMRRRTSVCWSRWKSCVTAEKAQARTVRRSAVCKFESIGRSCGGGRRVKAMRRVVSCRSCVEDCACVCNFSVLPCPRRRIECRFAKQRFAVHVVSRLLEPSMKRLTLTGFTKRGLSRVVVVVVRSRKARVQCDLWKAAKFACG